MNTRQHFPPASRLLAATILASTVWAGSCSDGVVDPTMGPELDKEPVLSDTTSRASLTGSSVPGQSIPLGASAPESDANVAYISLPPGTAPNGVTASIRNARTGHVVTVLLVAGGFDPVAVPATEGDLLEVDVRAANGEALLHYVRAVPGKRPPKVVRTSPPSGKRDVALNATISIVFSEPIDASTVDETAIQLLHNGVSVAGSVTFPDTSHLTAVFILAAPLASGTDYQLLVTEAVRDLDGDAVQTPVTVSFTTVASGSPTLSGSIAFSNFASISVINAARSGVTTLVDGGQGWEYAGPTWSPDGRKIAFASTRDGLWDIYVMEADGSWLTRLTRATHQNREPAWSPDGTRLAFASDRDGDFEIYVMPADGVGLTKLTDRPSHDRHPSWSPDGSRIAFNSDSGVYVVNVNGSGLTRVTDGRGDVYPEWSPDGQRILFARGSVLHVMNADGSRVRSLNVQGSGARWTPDGTQIVFSNWNLFLINADATGLRNLNVYGYEPSWSAGPPP
jgi:WD40 repeat protein